MPGALSAGLLTHPHLIIFAAVQAETTLSPLSLLEFLKDVESDVGRVESFRNGPRAIDLDILTYDDITLDTRDVHERHNLDNLTGHLVIPHPRLAEREFVLRPLTEYVIFCLVPFDHRH